MNQTPSQPPNDVNSVGGSTGRDEPFPPKLPRWKTRILQLAAGFSAIASLYVIEQLCVGKFIPSLCGTYIGFGIMIAALIIDRYFRHKLLGRVQ